MSFFKNIQLQKLLAIAALLILYIFFAVFGRNFASTSTTLNILSSSYYIGFLAIGVTFVIITGGMDLSIGALMMCSGLIGGLLYRTVGLPLWVCLIAAVAFGTLVGFINGILVTKMKLPPFIATLGTMMVCLGFGSIITKTNTMYYPSISVAEKDNWFSRVFLKTQQNFPMGLVFLVAFFVIAFIVLNKTKLGRYTFAVGSNEEAVRLSGVNSDKWKCVAYVISGFSSGLGAIFYAATYMVVIPNTGNGMELDAIAAVVIGGTSLAGGVGSLTGTMIGVFIMSVLSNGLISMRLPAPYQTFFTGIVVIGAVLLDRYRTKKANEVKKVKM
ncbi:MAG: ABC transporter permease [Clostridiales bacterium]|jgi:ribose transport system permease protein|nr:ABC transporter permease [Clostridiales bacterium]